MKRFSKFCVLRYSELLSIPIIGSYFYFIQIQLLNLGLLKIFFASNKITKERANLFKNILKQFNITYCQSFNFARNLRNLRTKPLILDLPNAKNVNNMEKVELYNLMWSLVFCKSVTQRTKKILGNFLPKNYVVTNNL